MDAPATWEVIIVAVSGVVIAALQYARRRFDVRGARRSQEERTDDAIALRSRIEALEDRQVEQRFAALEQRLGVLERRIDKRELVCEANHGGPRLE